MEPIKCAIVYRNNDNKYSLVCTICDEKFYTLKQLVHHVDLHFERKSSYTDLDILESVKINLLTTDASNSFDEDMKPEINVNDCYEIKLVPEEIGTKENYTFTMNDFEDDKSTLLNVQTDTKEAIPSNDPFNEQEINDTPFECDLCQKKFKYRKNIAQHMSVHIKKLSPPTPLKCAICFKAYTRKGKFVKHQQICSTGYVCPKCNKVYKTANSLRTHKKAQHPDDIKQLIKCDECDFTTRYSGNLVQHKRKHTGEKPYPCKVCKKSFTLSSYLKIHMRLHEDIKEFQCSFCGQCFSMMHNLKSHTISNHTKEKKIQCDLCDLSFNKKSLKHHRLTHTGERNYFCEICKKSFARLSTLRQHQLLHADNKKYKCRFCDMNFAQKAGLSAHERSQHRFIAN